MRFAISSSVFALALLVASSGDTRAEETPADTAKVKAAAAKLADDKQALKPWQMFVGQWRGVGQPRRGSTAGSWIEEADWAWKFEKGRAALVFQAPKGKHFTAGRIERAEKPGRFRFIGTLPDGKTEIIYTGGSEEGRITLTAEHPPKPPLDKGGVAGVDAPARVSLRTVAEGDRLLILYERRLGDTDRFLRLAEVGYTRKGSDFGKIALARECVVTGGAGTIQVTHMGQTYWVCCTGCRDLFNDDPEGVLAEYKARKEKEKSGE